MKFLLDEMLAPAIARELRARGHDVEAIAGHPAKIAVTHRPGISSRLSAVHLHQQSRQLSSQPGLPAGACLVP